VGRLGDLGLSGRLRDLGLAGRLGDLEPRPGGTSAMFWRLSCWQAPCELRLSPKKSMAVFWVGRRRIAGTVSFLGAGVVLFCISPSTQPRMGTLQTCHCVIICCFGLDPLAY